MMLAQGGASFSAQPTSLTAPSASYFAVSSSRYAPASRARSSSRNAPGSLRVTQPFLHHPQHHSHQQQHQQQFVCRAAPPRKPTSLYPKGKKEARVDIPACMIIVSASDVVGEGGTQSGGVSEEELSRVVGAGATAVVLRDQDSGSASTLYEAAVKLKELLRGRAALLLVDRTDIVQAVEADGVLLSDKGVPVVVAKRMLSGSSGGLVGRIVTNAPAAVDAAANGASLLLVTAEDGGPPSPELLQAACKQQRSGNAIPVLLAATCAPERLKQSWMSSSSGSGSASAQGALVGMDGLALGMSMLPAAGSAALGHSDGAGSPLSPAAAVPPILERLAQAGAGSSGDSSSSVASVMEGAKDSAPSSSGSSRASRSATADQGHESGVAAGGGAATKAAPAQQRVGQGWAQRLLDAEKGALLNDERAALARVLAFLQEVVPDLSELILLKDAVKQLDEPFLVAVVGEFNSGKSSVINSLLGKKFLAEGILPTTNEICILKFSDEEGAETRIIQQADGLYVKTFPSKLLEEMHIVDTPGTNVILERQQRLTEEYIPRADLVLFVMSVDRAFSESEVRFLEYIRQWRKKVVFVINKADMLTSADEVEALKRFVGENASRVLKLDKPPVVPVSSRSAMRAKEAAYKGLPPGTHLSYDAAELASHPDWEPSGFAAFERLIYNFLVGSAGKEKDPESPEAGTAGEGVRLKLQTPLFVADALIGAAGQRLAEDLSAAKADLESIRLVGSQLAQFRKEMESDASTQRMALQKILTTAVSRTDAFIDRTLALSNASNLIAYVTGGKAKEELSGRSLEKFEAEAVGNSFDQLKAAVEEHSRWLVTNCEAQLAYYQSFVAQRAQEAEAAGRPLPQRASAAPAAILSTASSNVLQIGGLNPPPSSPTPSEPSSSNGTRQQPSQQQEGGTLASEVASTSSLLDGVSNNGNGSSSDNNGSSRSSGNGNGANTNPATVSQAAEAASDYVQQLTFARQKGMGSAAMVWRTVEGFDMRAAVALLDEELREAVLGTASTALGAPAAGLVATGIIGNTLEDVLVLGLAGVAAYVSVLNLPLRRSEIKAKAARIACNFVEAVQGRMEIQVNEAVNFSVKAIETAVAPLEEVTAEEVARLEALDAQRADLAQTIQKLQNRVANLE